MTDIAKIQHEITEQLADKEVFNALVNTTFKAVPSTLIKRAIMEGRMRGFTFKDFLEKNIYAIGYGEQYNLVTSIDYARKIGMRGGVCGKSAPTYVEDSEGKIVSCTITVRKLVGSIVGDFTATTFFDEYYAGHKNSDGTIKTNKYGNVKPNLWDTKPRTMIAKVTEMHALRMACPEEAAQMYVEEEYQKDTEEVQIPFDVTSYKSRIESVKSMEELAEAWATLPAEAKIDATIMALKDEIKAKFLEHPETPEPIIQVEDKNDKK